MKKPSAYIRFLKLVEGLKTKGQILKLDSTEKQLLDNIMIDDYDGRSVFIGDLLRLDSLGSQATLHGRVKHLNALGYIELVTQIDARRKRVIPTNKAYKRYELLSGCMDNLCEQYPQSDPCLNLM